MSYPKEIVLRRLINELRDCTDFMDGNIEIDPENTELPLTIGMKITDTLAYATRDKVVSEHEFSVTITKDYGQCKPEVRWKTEIFHPNIMSPKDGGLVCIKMLNEWTYGTRLSSFLNGIMTLLVEPNVASPFGTDSCKKAAEFFASKGKARISASVK